MQIGEIELTSFSGAVNSPIDSLFIIKYFSEIGQNIVNFTQDDFFALMPGLLEIVNTKELKTDYKDIVTEIQTFYTGKYKSYLSVDYHTKFQKEREKEILDYNNEIESKKDEKVKEEILSSPISGNSSILDVIRSNNQNKGIDIGFLTAHWEDISELFVNLTKDDYYTILYNLRRTEVEFRPPTYISMVNTLAASYSLRFGVQLNGKYYLSNKLKELKRIFEKSDNNEIHVINGIDIRKVDVLPDKFVLENKDAIERGLDLFTKEDFLKFMPDILKYLHNTEVRSRYDFFHQYLLNLKYFFIKKFKDCRVRDCDNCNYGEGKEQCNECPLRLWIEVKSETVKPSKDQVEVRPGKLHLVNPKIVVCGKNIEVLDDEGNPALLVSLEGGKIDIATDHLEMNKVKTSRGLMTSKEVEGIISELDKYRNVMRMLNNLNNGKEGI